MDRRTYARTYRPQTFETSFIRSTLGMDDLGNVGAQKPPN